VAGSIAYDDASRTATFTPTAALAFSTVYTANLGASIRARDGMPLAAAVQWSHDGRSGPPAGGQHGADCRRHGCDDVDEHQGDVLEGHGRHDADRRPSR
jgi:hypothetical protein